MPVPTSPLREGHAACVKCSRDFLVLGSDSRTCERCDYVCLCGMRNSALASLEEQVLAEPWSHEMGDDLKDHIASISSYLDFAAFSALKLGLPSSDKHHSHVFQLHVEACTRPQAQATQGCTFKIVRYTIASRQEYIKAMRERGGEERAKEMFRLWDREREAKGDETLVGIACWISVMDRGEKMKESVFDYNFLQTNQLCQIRDREAEGLTLRHDPDWFSRLVRDVERTPELSLQDYVNIATYRMWHSEAESQIFEDYVLANPTEEPVRTEEEKRREKNAKKKARKLRNRVEGGSTGT